MTVDFLGPKSDELKSAEPINQAMIYAPLTTRLLLAAICAAACWALIGWAMLA